MEIPKYVLKTYELAWAPKKNNTSISMVKNGVRIITILLLLASVIFHKNLFAEMSVTSQILLITLFLGTFFVSDKEKVEKPFEIRFYDDYLVLYREKQYYSPRLIRMEFDKFMYANIKKVQYRTETGRINIYGVVEGIWYNYNKDGSLPCTPSYHKTTDSIAYFYTGKTPNTDFVKEIEAHAPIKVTIENS